MAQGHDPLRRVFFEGRGKAFNGEAIKTQTRMRLRQTKRKQQPEIAEFEAASKRREQPDVDDRTAGDKPAKSDETEESGPSNWMDHPITRALNGLYQDGAVPDPVQIIADSVDRRPRDTETTPKSYPVVEAVVSIDTTSFPEPGPYAQFWQVWAVHQNYLLKQCLKFMAGNRADAEDALSNAMLRAAQKYVCYTDTIVNERAWLNRLVQNVCIDHFRRQRRETHWEADEDAMPKSVSPLFQKSQQTPEEITLTQQQLQKLQDQISHLSPKLRVPLLMRFVGGMSYNEIAESLNVKCDTVRKRIQLARERLRGAGFW